MSRPGDETVSDKRKRILEETAAHPDADADEIAENVTDVSATLVERVLADRDGGIDAETDAPEANHYPDREEISDRQIRTLQAIAAHPDATQRDIASFLDVTAATVSNRVNSLPGFDWEDRREFVGEVLDLDAIPGSDRAADAGEHDLYEMVQDLRDRVERLEQRSAGAEPPADDPTNTPFDDPELARKVIHLCLEAEEITDDEEQRILEYFLE
jgi:hypothetical protein